MSLILASNSQIRSHMLAQCGVEFEVRSPDFDEEATKTPGLNGEGLAIKLSEGKACSIDCGPYGWVVGSDSVISVDGVSYSKPRDREQAAQNLRVFSGRT